MDTSDQSSEDLAANQPFGLLQQLTSVQEEHFDLNATIDHLTKNPPEDQLLIRRLKKRKLRLKDRIMQIESSLKNGPDEYA
jgi:hypothetical protein